MECDRLVESRRELLGRSEDLGLRGERRMDRGLLEYSVRLAASGPAADHASGGIRRLRPVADRRQGRRVRCREMARDVEQHDRRDERGAVEVVPRRMPPLREQRVVVAPADHELARGRRAFRDARPQGGHDVLDRLHRTDRRRRDVQMLDEQHDHADVAVGIDEAGQERTLPELDDARRAADPPRDLLARADRDDRVATDGDGLGALGRLVHRQDVSPEEDEVGLRQRRSGLRRGRRRTGGEQRDEHDDRGDGRDRDREGRGKVRAAGDAGAARGRGDPHMGDRGETAIERERAPSPDKRAGRAGPNTPAPPNPAAVSQPAGRLLLRQIEDLSVRMRDSFADLGT